MVIQGLRSGAVLTLARGRGFDMGSITVPDRSLLRQKKSSLALVFCKLRPSFSLPRQRSTATWTYSPLPVNLNSGSLPHSEMGVKSTNRRFFGHLPRTLIDLNSSMSAVMAIMRLLSRAPRHRYPAQKRRVQYCTTQPCHRHEGLSAWSKIPLHFAPFSLVPWPLGPRPGTAVYCIACGAGVPSDQWSTQTIMIVIRSSGSLAAITGEAARSAPQLLAASPGINHMRCGCQFLASSFKYCCFDIM